MQTALLTRALELVRPGGVVVYATCSPHLAETRAVVDAVLGVRSGNTAAEPVNLWPHVDGTDAMFWTLLTKAV